MEFHPEPRGGVDERARSARRHVVVLDADPAVLNLVRVLLEEERYAVSGGNYEGSTHAAIAASQPGLVIMDLVWGEQAGWDLLGALALDAATADIPVLITSTDRRLLAEATANPDRFGAHRGLIKPFDVDELVQTVRELAGPAELDSPDLA